MPCAVCEVSFEGRVVGATLCAAETAGPRWGEVFEVRVASSCRSAARYVVLELFDRKKAHRVGSAYTDEPIGTCRCALVETKPLVEGRVFCEDASSSAASSPKTPSSGEDSLSSWRGKNNTPVPVQSDSAWLDVIGVDGLLAGQLALAVTCVSGSFSPPQPWRSPVPRARSPYVFAWPRPLQDLYPPCSEVHASLVLQYSAEAPLGRRRGTREDLLGFVNGVCLCGVGGDEVRDEALRECGTIERVSGEHSRDTLRGCAALSQTRSPNLSRSYHLETHRRCESRTGCE